MIDLPYYALPEIPAEISATTTIARLVDGLGFRYRWATEDLTPKDFDFKPVEGSFNMTELINHIYNLVNTCNRILGGKSQNPIDKVSVLDTRIATLNLIFRLSEHLKLMTDLDLNQLELDNQSIEKQFPIMFVLNGPLADALTHVGQITSWRRIAGNPQPKVNVFLGVKK